MNDRRFPIRFTAIAVFLALLAALGVGSSFWGQGLTNEGSWVYFPTDKADEEGYLLDIVSGELFFVESKYKTLVTPKVDWKKPQP